MHSLVGHPPAPCSLLRDSFQRSVRSGFQARMRPQDACTEIMRVWSLSQEPENPGFASSQHYLDDLQRKSVQGQIAYEKRKAVQRRLRMKKV